MTTKLCDCCRKPLEEIDRGTAQTAGGIAGSLGGSFGGSMVGGMILGPVGAIAGAIGGAFAGGGPGRSAGEGVAEAWQGTRCEECKKRGATPDEPNGAGTGPIKTTFECGGRLGTRDEAEEEAKRNGENSWWSSSDQQPPQDVPATAAPVASAVGATGATAGMPVRHKIDVLEANEGETLTLPRCCKVLSAWYGHPDDERRRIDLSASLKALCDSKGPTQMTKVTAKAGALAELSLTDGSDPAMFCSKKLSVTIER